MIRMGENFSDSPQEYLYLVRDIVDRIDIKLPDHWDKEDMIGYGVLGLMEALTRFKPEKGVKFSTFASLRIRGAILDALRKEAPLPRTKWKKVRQVTEVMEDLYMSTGDEVSLQTVADKLGMDKREVEETLESFKLLSHISLEQTLGYKESNEIKVGDIINISPDNELESIVLKKEEIETLSKAISKLDKRQRLVLTLYYYEELTLKEIASVMDLGIARVSQIKTLALANLRKIMENAN